MTLFVCVFVFMLFYFVLLSFSSTSMGKNSVHLLF